MIIEVGEACANPMQIDVWWTIGAIFAAALMTFSAAMTFKSDILAILSGIGCLLFFHSTDALCLDRPKNLLAIVIGLGIIRLFFMGFFLSLLGAGGGSGTEPFQQGGDW
jgi:hypothetical protein